MEVVGDLYMHSTCSDERYPSHIILEKVIKDGLTTFFISEHDTIAHIPIVNNYIENINIDIQYIVTAELTCEFDGDSVHILGYLQKNKISHLSDIFN